MSSALALWLTCVVCVSECWCGCVLEQDREREREKERQSRVTRESQALDVIGSGLLADMRCVRL